MARTARRHFYTFVFFALFALVFTAFLLVAGYYYLAGAPNASLQSFTPGLPALFLGFMARNEFRAWRAARKTEARLKAKAAAAAVAERVG
ncbi:hypothetical protein QWY85_09910 [Neolewinella lacunae]|uniref:Uncharacterized protein n=1 Tax=Neolewinella lacunae TaxID=1517758 RepID=A0A923PH32_9BACT|nr:hypothetical protein [Neolewinella lacunae]MBC6993945.1 hypothetical protein [Neolewinella lacunae]MDN3634974.1 hypothetical protein [Neolewinella lacunae]